MGSEGLKHYLGITRVITLLFKGTVARNGDWIKAILFDRSVLGEEPLVVMKGF
jgi:hypothetical protein